MRKKEKTRVIWIHPQGRFELRETEHYSLFEGRTYHTRYGGNHREQHCA